MHSSAGPILRECRSPSSASLSLSSSPSSEGVSLVGVSSADDRDLIPVQYPREIEAATRIRNCAAVRPQRIISYAAWIVVKICATCLAPSCAGLRAGRSKVGVRMVFFFLFIFKIIINKLLTQVMVVALPEIVPSQILLCAQKSYSMR